MQRMHTVRIRIKMASQKVVTVTVKVVSFPVKFTTDQIFGESHTESHRITVGLVVGFCGVLIAHTSSEFPHMVGLMVDYVGYGFHGMGFYPTFEFIRRKVNDLTK